MSCELQPPAAKKRGPLQLLDAIDARDKALDNVVAMPPGFLEEYSARFAAEGLLETVEPIGQ